MFDTADVYSAGVSEEVLGAAIKGKRERLLNLHQGHPSRPAMARTISVRRGSICWTTVHGSLKRLGTDRIDLLQLHGQDYNTPVEETLATLDQLVREGKVRYIGGSNFSGWHLMKALAAADRHGFPRHVAHQVYYSLLNRDYEWELMPLGIDQGVGAVIWSPLGWGKLTARSGAARPPPPARARQHPGHRAALRRGAAL